MKIKPPEDNHQIPLEGKSAGNEMKIKGYVIDPQAGLISPVHLTAENLAEYRALVKAEHLDSAPVFHNNRAWVSDTGMLEQLTPFLIASPSYDVMVLWGRALIIGQKPPHCVSCTVGITDVARNTARLKKVVGDGDTAVMTVDTDNPTFAFAEPQLAH